MKTLWSVTSDGLIDRKLYDKYILKKPEYGTDEYWQKERKSKFKRDARQKEDAFYKLHGAVINVWAQTIKVEMPHYSFMNKVRCLPYKI